MRPLVLVLRLFLAAVFLYAAYTKLRQPYLLFAMSIDAYQLLPEWAVLTLARIIPWLELLLGHAIRQRLKTCGTPCRPIIDNALSASLISTRSTPACWING